MVHLVWSHNQLLITQALQIPSGFFSSPHRVDKAQEKQLNVLFSTTRVTDLVGKGE